MLKTFGIKTLNVSRAASTISKPTLSIASLYGVHNMFDVLFNNLSSKMKILKRSFFLKKKNHSLGFVSMINLFISLGSWIYLFWINTTSEMNNFLHPKIRYSLLYELLSQTEFFKFSKHG